MRVTWGKVIWFISFLIFLIISYNMNTFERIWDVVAGQDESAQNVAEYDPFAEQGTVDTVVVSDAEVEALLNSVEPMTDESATVEEPVGTIHIKVERLVWEMEQLGEEVTNLKITVEELNGDKDTTVNNLIAIIGALTPLILPFVSRKFGTHNKEIINRKV